MPLSWNEIRNNALAFAREWADETSEDAEAKSFWDGFFEVFGIRRRRVASFEKPVHKGGGKGGFIDLLWKGVLLVEHKSRGKDLDRAAKQAFDCFPGLKERDLPRYVLVSDFARFRLYDLDEGTQTDFPLAQLSRHVRLLGFIAGYQSRKSAAAPSLFFDISQPATNYLVIPEVSSERREFIPIGCVGPGTICSNTNCLIPEATPFMFGILTSSMHMAWTWAVCGRLKSDYRYSGSIVYNNLPWPSPAEKQYKAVERAAQEILAARALYPSSTLADLYDPLTMPPELLKAHKTLDRAVDAAYGKVSFASEAERVAFLFRLYQRLAG